MLLNREATKARNILPKAEPEPQNFKNASYDLRIGKILTLVGGTSRSNSYRRKDGGSNLHGEGRDARRRGRLSLVRAVAKSPFTGRRPFRLGRRIRG